MAVNPWEGLYFRSTRNLTYWKWPGSNAGRLITEDALFSGAPPPGGVALTGASATSQVGSVAASVSIALSGVSATGQTGAVTASQGASAALTGSQASGTTGALAAAVGVALAGVSATAQTGALAASARPTLTGTAATGAVGVMAPTVAVTITGVQAVGQAGNVTASAGAGAVLTGVSATGEAGSATPSTASTLTGAQAAGQSGAVSASVSVSLIGAGADGQTGTLTPAVSGDVNVTLTGVQASGETGALTPEGEADGGTKGNGGSLFRRRLVKPYQTETARQEAKRKLPRIPPAERDAINRAARALAALPEFDEGAVDRILEQAMPPGVEPVETHLHWLLYLLRIQAHRLAQEQDDEDVILMLM